MATINKSVLGKVRGAVGDIVFRQRNGKYFVSTKPGRRKKTDNPELIALQNRFKLSVQTASVLLKNDALKLFWSVYTPLKRNALNYCVKKIHPAVTDDNLTEYLSIVPSIGFPVSIDNTGFDENGITLLTDPIGSDTDIDTENETGIAAVALLYYKEPVDTSVDSYYLFNIKSQIVPLNLTEQLSLSIPFNGIEKQLYNRYQTRKAFITLITFSGNGNPVHHSGTLHI